MEAISSVIIVVHLMVIVVLVAVVLLQRSEGGALGIGGSNAFMSARGQGNVLTRATTILGIAFFATSIAMTVMGRLQAPESSILENVPAATAPATLPPAGPLGPVPPADAGSGGILDGQAPATVLPAEPQVPTSQ